MVLLPNLYSVYSNLNFSMNPEQDNASLTKPTTIMLPILIIIASKNAHLANCSTLGAALGFNLEDPTRS